MIDGLDAAGLKRELEAGGRLVSFDYVISVCVLTFSQGSRLHLIRAGEGTFFKSLPYNLLSLLLGWWAIPFGPFLTLGALFLNLRGGNDLTAQAFGPTPRPGERPSRPRHSWNAWKKERPRPDHQGGDDPQP